MRKINLDGCNITRAHAQVNGLRIRGLTQRSDADMSNLVSRFAGHLVKKEAFVKDGVVLNQTCAPHVTVDYLLESRKDMCNATKSLFTYLHETSTDLNEENFSGRIESVRRRVLTIKTERMENKGT